MNGTSGDSGTMDETFAATMHHQECPQELYLWKFVWLGQNKFEAKIRW